MCVCVLRFCCARFRAKCMEFTFRCIWYFGMFLELSPDFGTNKCDNIFSAHLNTLEMFNSQRRMQFYRDDFPITVFDYILSFQYLQFRYLKCSPLPHSMVLKSMHVIVVICHNAIRYIFTISPHKLMCYLWGVRRSNNMSFVNELWPQNHLHEFVVCGLGINITNDKIHIIVLKFIWCPFLVN